MTFPVLWTNKVKLPVYTNTVKKRKMTFFIVWLSKRTLNTNYITNVQTQTQLKLEN